MKAAIWRRPTQYGAYKMLNMFADGITATGGEVEYLDPLAEPLTPRRMQIFDVHIIFSAMYQRSDKILAACAVSRLERGITPRPVIVLDGAWMQREKYWGVGLNGINGDADFKNKNSLPDRFKALDLDVEPIIPRDGYILVIGQKLGDISLPCDRIEWAIKTVQKIKKYTDRRIVYRPHPSDYRNKGFEGVMRSEEDLDFDLYGAAAVVTHTSNVVVDGVLRGLPIFTTGRSVAWPVAQTDLAKLADLNDPTSLLDDEKRMQFLYDLACAQWTAEEIKAGIPFRRLMGLEEIDRLSASAGGLVDEWRSGQEDYVVDFPGGQSDGEGI